MDKFGFPRRVDVSEELREIVLDFLISCMLDQPDNLPKYGIDFFTKLENKRRTEIVYDLVQTEKDYARCLPPEECSEKELAMSSVEDEEVETNAEDEWSVVDWMVTSGDVKAPPKRPSKVDEREDTSTIATELETEAEEEEEEEMGAEPKLDEEIQKSIVNLENLESTAAPNASLAGSPPKVTSPRQSFANKS